MMTFPPSIHQYLLDMGFTGSELSILTSLNHNEGLSLREIARITQKSTGALDVAMKKLMRKNIVVRCTVNDQPRYALESLERVIKVTHMCIEERNTELSRKQRNLEQYFSTMSGREVGMSLQHCSGDEHIARAYEELLMKRKEFLTFASTVDVPRGPLATMHERMISRRKACHIPHRVIIAPSQKAKRLQFRDGCEYRTTFIFGDPTEECALEKVIVDDTLLIVDYSAHTASIIRHPTLAMLEADHFNTLWKFLEPEKEKTVWESPVPVRTVRYEEEVFTQ